MKGEGWGRSIFQFKKRYGPLIYVVGITFLVLALRVSGEPLLAAFVALLAAPALISSLGSPSFALMVLTFILMAGKVFAEGGLRSALGIVTGTLNDPFVIILFAGFAFLALVFGRADMEQTPPWWALRKHEQSGRVGEFFRGRIGKLLQGWIRAALPVRLGVMVVGLIASLCSSNLGALAMIRLAGVRQRTSSAPQAGVRRSLAVDEQVDGYLVTVALALCTLAPAILPASIWGVYFQTVTEGTKAVAGLKALGVEWFSYPLLGLVFVPFLAWWMPRSRRFNFGAAVAVEQTAAKGVGWRLGVSFIVAYVSMYLVAEGIRLVGSHASVGGPKPLLAAMLSVTLIGLLFWRTFRRVRACRMTSDAAADFKDTEWQLVMHGFEKAIPVLIIVLFAASFKDLVSECTRAKEECVCCRQEIRSVRAHAAAEKYMMVHDPSGHLGRQDPFVGSQGKKVLSFLAAVIRQIPLTALMLLVLAVLLIGRKIGTAFGTFAIGFALLLLLFDGLLGPGDWAGRPTSILIWTLISCATFVNQTSLQADNVLGLKDFSPPAELVHRVHWLILGPFLLSMVLSLVLWGWQVRANRWDCLLAGAVAVLVGVRLWRWFWMSPTKAFEVKGAEISQGAEGLLPKATERRDMTSCVWITCIGVAAENFLRDKRIRGDVVDFYSVDNDRATSGYFTPLKPNLQTLLRFRWSYAATPNPDDRAFCLLVLLGDQVKDRELMDSRLLAQSLSRGIPVRFASLRPGIVLSPLAIRMGEGTELVEIHDLRTFFRALIDSLNDWMTKEIGTSGFAQWLWQDLQSRKAFARLATGERNSAAASNTKQG